jgi:hypothetical protein
MRMLSQIATQIRGSVGGLCFTANRFYPIVGRARQGPKRIMTNYQVNIRSAMSGAIAAWNALTPASRGAWQTYASSVPFTGPLGVYYITGLNMFIRSFILLTYMNTRFAAGLVDTWEWGGVVMIGEPDIGPIVVTDYVGPGTGIAISVTNECGIDCNCLIRVSPSFTPARQKSPGIWDQNLSRVENCPTGVSTLIEIDDLVEDGVYFISCRPLTEYFADLLEPPIATTEYVLRSIAETVSP